MKDRLKKYYKDHEDTIDTIVFSSVFFATQAIIFGCGYTVANQKRVVAVSTDRIEDPTKIFVHLKNGFIRSYSKPTK